MNYASYNGYIKKLLGLIFILSDDFSMFKAKDNRDSDLLMCFDLLHAQCLSER